MGGSGYEELQTSSSEESGEESVDTKNDHLPFVDALSEIKDKISEVVMAVVKGSMNRARNTPQMSAYTLQKAILHFYEEKKLFPQGLCSALPAVQDWALKQGVCDQRGDPGDLAELPNSNCSDVSTMASDLGSGVSVLTSSSTSSSVLSDKIARLVNQVKSIQIAASKSTGNADGDSGGNMKKDPKQSLPMGPNEKKELPLPPGDSPHERVAAVLKMAKARRLEAEKKMTSDPEQTTKAPTAHGSSSHDSTGGDEIPEYVP
eukprot:s220_g21.t1